MAFVATVVLKNGIGFTATGATLKNDAWQFTGTTPANLDTIAASGGLPTGVANVDASGIPGAAVARVPVGYITSVSVA